MKSTGFAAVLAAGWLLAGPASAFVIIHQDVYEGDWTAPSNTLADGATRYLRFESAIPVSAFVTDIFQYKSYEWYNADGTKQGYGNDNPDPIHLNWQPVNGAMEAIVTLPSAYRVDLGGADDPYILWYYQMRHLQIFYDVHNAEYNGLPWTITYSDAPIASVPEPATWALMIVGFGLLGAALRRSPRTATMTSLR